LPVSLAASVFDVHEAFAKVEAKFQQVARPGLEAEAKAQLEEQLAAAELRAREVQGKGAVAEYWQARRREEVWQAHQRYHEVVEELDSKIGIGLRFAKWTRDNADWIRSQKTADLERWKAAEEVGSWFYCLCELELARLEERAEVKPVGRARSREALKRKTDAALDAKRKVSRLMDASKALRKADAAFGGAGGRIKVPD
jgi:hypothetical protein